MLYNKVEKTKMDFEIAIEDRWMFIDNMSDFRGQHARMQKNQICVNVFVHAPELSVWNVRYMKSI